MSPTPNAALEFPGSSLKASSNAISAAALFWAAANSWPFWYAVGDMIKPANTYVIALFAARSETEAVAYACCSYTGIEPFAYGFANEKLEAVRRHATIAAGPVFAPDDCLSRPRRGCLLNPARCSTDC